MGIVVSRFKRRRGRRRRQQPKVTTRPLVADLRAAADSLLAPRRNSVPKTTPLGMTNLDKTMPLLYSLARSWAWGAVEYRSQTHPEEASAVDYLGDNALHWVVFGRPPIEPVQALLNANPSLARVANRKGLLPLHMACSYRASPQVIAALLEVYPEAAGVATSDGSLPLHLMCDFGCTVEALVVMLQTEACIKRIFDKDQIYQRRALEILNGRKNLSELEFHRTLDIMRQTRREQQTEGVVAGQEEVERLNQRIDKFRNHDFWKKAALLTLVEYTGEGIPANVGIDSVLSSPRVLRACVANPLCPGSIQEFAILLNIDQLLTPDENGNLPLHLAARTGNSLVIQKLLQAQPKAAAIRNKEGCLPLSIMLRNKNRGWSDGVGYLVQSYPCALADENLDARLYPRVWARLSSSVLYQAVRANPNVFIQNK